MRAAIASLLAKAAALVAPSILQESRQSMAVKAAEVAADAQGVTLNAAQSILLSFGVIPFTQPGSHKSGSYTKRGPGRKAHKSARSN